MCNTTCPEDKSKNNIPPLPPRRINPIFHGAAANWDLRRGSLVILHWNHRRRWNFSEESDASLLTGVETSFIRIIRIFPFARNSYAFRIARRKKKKLAETRALINEFRSMKWIAHARHAQKAHVRGMKKKVRVPARKC